MNGMVNKKSSIDLTDLIGKRTVIVLAIAVFLLVCSVSIFSGEGASIGGYMDSPAPTALKAAFSADGAVSIFAPANTAGHWEVGGEFFSDQTQVLFCPIDRFGIEKYTFVPEDPRICESSVYAIVCRFR